MLMCFRVTIVFTFTWAAKEEVLGNTCGRGVTCLEVTAPSLLPLIPLASPLPLTCACVRGGGLPVCRISATVTCLRSQDPPAHQTRMRLRKARGGLAFSNQREAS